MLFLGFLAGVMGSSGWMLFWSVLGLVFSSRPWVCFLIPLAAAILGVPEVGVAAIVVTWVMLFYAHANKVAEREERRAQIVETLRRVDRR